tara:strand:+ start:688 stop:957 length:270 start_codon:yes stop_codon:yes gene_type:complete
MKKYVNGQLVDMTSEEQTEIENMQKAFDPTVEQWRDLRSLRNSLLSSTDHFALADNTLSDDMKTYRQSLRDLPANTSDPTNPTWPTKPS